MRSSRLLRLCLVLSAMLLLSVVVPLALTNGVWMLQQDKVYPSSFEYLLSRRRRYMRYDEAGLRLKPIPGTARSHHLPNAVPITRTIPRNRAENKSYHLSQRTNTSLPLSIYPKHRSHAKRIGGEFYLGQYNWKHSYEDDYRTLYLYNPSLLPLHNNNNIKSTTSRSSADHNPDNLEAKDLLQLTGGDPSVRYLVTYRAYLGCNCFGPDPKRELMKAGEQVSYLAVALLNESLDVVPGTDVLIDLNAGPTRGQYWRQSVEDCRLFGLRGGIYLVCNEEIFRLRIARRATKEGHQQKPIPPEYGTRDDQRIPYAFANIYGNGLEVTIISHNNKIGGGKNFNMFTSLAPSNRSKAEINTGALDYYVQTYPSPHVYQRLMIPDGQEDVPPKIPIHMPEWAVKEADPGVRIPRPSFDTPDHVNPILMCKDGSMNCTRPISVPFFREDDHGTACCVHMSLRDGRHVMVGISHQKLSRKDPRWLKDVRGRYDHLLKDQFVSRFVAYGVDPPFDIIARSGWFCLGFADDTERTREGGSSLAGRNTNARLHLYNDTFACPSIHFISGFAEVVGDTSRAIIAYGVNDCHPRMFMVQKNDIAELLGSWAHTSPSTSRNPIQ